MCVARKLWVFVVSGSLAVVTGCGLNPSGEGSETTENLLPETTEVLLADKTKLVGDEGPVRLVASDNDVLHFTTIGSEVIAEGDILLGSEDGGFLRRVDSVTGDSTGSMSVQTSQVPITEAIEQGHFRGSTPINPSANDAVGKWQRLARVGVNGELDLSGIELINEPGLHVQVTQGDVFLSGGVDWEIDVRFPSRLHYFETTVDGRLDLDLDVQVEANLAGQYAKETQVFKQSKPFLVGVVAGRVIVTIYAGIEANASAEGTLNTGLDSSTSFETGANWNGAWHPIAERSTDFQMHDWTWNLEGTVGARAYVRPEIEVEFYGTVGPGLDLEPYLGFDGSVQMPSCLYDWDLRVGIASHANFRAGILDWDLIDYQATLFDWSTSIASDEGDLCPTPVYCLTTSIEGGGNVSLNPRGGCYEEGTQVRITAQAASGWKFDHWENDASGTIPTTTVIMNGDRNVAAVFEEENVCTTDADCPTGEECVAGECEPIENECTIDADCALSEECVGGECEPVNGWTQNPTNGHLYRLSSPGTWEDAESEAVSLGGHLVTINDAAEQQWLNEHFPRDESQGDPPLWIGLYQLPGSSEPGGGWVWVSSEPVTFTNWHPAEPNDGNPSVNERFAELHHFYIGPWNDAIGEKSQPGIIEIGSAIPPSCNVVYSEDFSTDPGWVTDDPGKLRWDSVSQVFHGTQVNTEGTYAYTIVDGFDPSSSWVLEFDTRINDCDWSAGWDFGLFDEQIRYSYSAEVHQGIADGGRGTNHNSPFVNPGASFSPAWTFGVWYHHVLDYDSLTGELLLTVTERSIGALFILRSLITPQLPVDLTRLGVTRLHMKNTGSGASPSGTVDYELDNIVLCQGR